MQFAKEISESLTYKFAQAAREMKLAGKDIISLGLGEPDFSTPDYVIESTIRAIVSGFTHYSDSQGWPELRELIASNYNDYYNTHYTIKEIIITPGVKSAIYFTLSAILKPYDEVILISPYYVSYPAIVKMAEPTAKVVDISLGNDFSLDISALKNAFNSNTKAIIINTPNNPTGAVLSKEEIDLIVELSLSNNAYIISDEVYEKLVYTGYKYTNFSLYNSIKDKLIICNGYSKSYAMTGWRLGYAVGNYEVITKMNKLHQHINTNTCTFIQVGACSIYKHIPDHIAPYVRELEERSEYFVGELNKLGYINAIRPKAGFFCFANIANTGVDSNTFCADLLRKTGIASTPGIAFGQKWDSYVRFSLAVPKAILEKAVYLLQKYRYND